MKNKNIDKLFKRALIRNLFEIERALSYINGYNEIDRVAPTTRWSFFSYSSLAMFDALIFHSMKILDEHPDAASFWFLHRNDTVDIETILNKNNLPIRNVRLLSKKLSRVRNKTHFHIDRNAVFNPDQIWKEADIRGNLLIEILNALWNTLREIHRIEIGKNFIQPIYDGNDIEKIIQLAKENGITV